MRAASVLSLLALTMVLCLPGVAAAQQSEDEKILDSRSGGTDTPAPRSDDDEELSTTYSSIGLQKSHVDVPGYETKDPINLDITLIGFRIPTVPWFSVELNLGLSMIPGQISSSSAGSSGGGVLCPPFCSGGSSGSNQSQDMRTQTAAAFAVMRSTGPFFVMGKLGYRYATTDLTDGNGNSYPENRTGSAYGVGVGYRWNKKGSYAELGYTSYGSAIDGIGFSVSYSYERH